MKRISSLVHHRHHTNKNPEAWDCVTSDFCFFGAASLVSDGGGGFHVATLSPCGSIVEKGWQDGAVVVLAGLRGTGFDGSMRDDIQGPLRASDECCGEEGGQSRQTGSRSGKYRSGLLEPWTGVSPFAGVNSVNSRVLR